MFNEWNVPFLFLEDFVFHSNSNFSSKMFLTQFYNLFFLFPLNFIFKFSKKSFKKKCLLKISFTQFQTFSFFTQFSKLILLKLMKPKCFFSFKLEKNSPDFFIPWFNKLFLLKWKEKKVFFKIKEFRLFWQNNSLPLVQVLNIGQKTS